MIIEKYGGVSVVLNGMGVESWDFFRIFDEDLIEKVFKIDLVRECVVF